MSQSQRPTVQKKISNRNRKTQINVPIILDDVRIDVAPLPEEVDQQQQQNIYDKYDQQKNFTERMQYQSYYTNDLINLHDIQGITDKTLFMNYFLNKVAHIVNIKRFLVIVGKAAGIQITEKNNNVDGERYISKNFNLSKLKEFNTVIFFNQSDNEFESVQKSVNRNIAKFQTKLKNYFEVETMLNDVSLPYMGEMPTYDYNANIIYLCNFLATKGSSFANFQTFIRGNSAPKIYIERKLQINSGYPLSDFLVTCPAIFESDLRQSFIFDESGSTFYSYQKLKGLLQILLNNANVTSKNPKLLIIAAFTLDKYLTLLNYEETMLSDMFSEYNIFYNFGKSIFLKSIPNKFIPVKALNNYYKYQRALNYMNKKLVSKGIYNMYLEQSTPGFEIIEYNKNDIDMWVHTKHFRRSVQIQEPPGEYAEPEPQDDTYSEESNSQVSETIEVVINTNDIRDRNGNKYNENPIPSTSGLQRVVPRRSSLAEPVPTKNNEVKYLSTPQLEKNQTSAQPVKQASIPTRVPEEPTTPIPTRVIKEPTTTVPIRIPEEPTAPPLLAEPKQILVPKRQLGSKPAMNRMLLPKRNSTPGYKYELPPNYDQEDNSIMDGDDEMNGNRLWDYFNQQGQFVAQIKLTKDNLGYDDDVYFTPEGIKVYINGEDLIVL